MNRTRFAGRNSPRGWPLVIAAMMALATAALMPQSAHAAGLLIADGGQGGVLQIKDHDVRVTINNGVAVTEVEQVFVNTEPRVVEALYTFPVPAKASVSNFSMWINGKEMIGEVVEKERARKIYESYKQVRRDPGLLEQVDYKRFEMRVFPIPAGAEQRVKVTYYQELDFDHDAATYVYPLATVTQNKADERTTGRFSMAFDVKSEIPMTELVSPSHKDQFAIAKHADAHYWQAALETKEGELSRDVVINLQMNRPTTGLDVVTSKERGEDGYMLLTLTAGKELEEKMTGSDYVYVLDISGSMANDGKLALSRNAVTAFVGSLEPEDRFELITFNIQARPLFNELASVDATTKERAADHLRSQRAMGGTVLRPAVEAAYRYRDADRRLNVVILSDGMTEQSEQRELLALIGQRPTNTSVFCVGVGNEVNRPLLSQLADNADGLAAFISTGDDFERQAAAFRRKLTRPAATNVKISFAGNSFYDVEPQTIPNLFYGQPLRLYARYKQPGPIQIRVQADVLGSPLDQTVDVTLPAVDATNPQIERMWASHKVDRLLREMRAGGSQSNVSEVVRLCEGYSIASEYASFIVLENDAEYQRWKIDRRNATRIERDRAAQAALLKRLESLRAQTAQQIGPGNSTDTASKDTGKQVVNAARPDANRGVDLAMKSNPNQVGPIDSTPSNRGIDLSLPDIGGGGAIDPFTAIAAGSLAAWGLSKRRRKQRSE
jgi:Ca-activated chloride channel family protein